MAVFFGKYLDYHVIGVYMAFNISVVLCALSYILVEYLFFNFDELGHEAMSRVVFVCSRAASICYELKIEEDDENEQENGAEAKKDYEMQIYK